MSGFEDFGDQMRAFTLKVESQSQAVFVNTVAAVQDSIVEGSAVTGAPGQPVDTGTLKASWHTDFESPTSALISSGGAAEDYNTVIEDGVGPHGPLTLRSAVGGFHSVDLTVAGFPEIVADEVAKVAQ